MKIFTAKQRRQEMTTESDDSNDKVNNNTQHMMLFSLLAHRDDLLGQDAAASFEEQNGPAEREHIQLRHIHDGTDNSTSSGTSSSS